MILFQVENHRRSRNRKRRKTHELQTDTITQFIRHLKNTFCVYLNVT